MLKVLLEADARGRGRVFPPAVDLREAGAAIEGECRLLVNARLEHEALHTHPFGGGLEVGQYSGPHSLAPLIGFDIHPFRLGGRGVEKADGATPDRSAIIARDEKGAAAAFEMLRLEVRPEALLRWIELGQAGVQRRDQSSGVLGVERFRGDGQGEIVHLQKDSHRIGCATECHRSWLRGCLWNSCGTINADVGTTSPRAFAQFVAISAIMPP